MPNTLALFTYLLMNAVYTDRKIGTPTGVVELKRGQFISGIHRLSNALEQSIQQVRTSLDRLHNLEIITSESTNRYTIYTIVNYSNYQDSNMQDNKLENNQTTNEQQAGNKLATTKEESKALKTEKKVKNKTAAVADDVFPDVLNRQLVEDWLVIRKAKKLPVTQTALDGITREFMKAGFSNDDGLRKCCEKGWAGFEAKWVFADAKGLEQQGDQAREDARARLFGGN